MISKELLSEVLEFRVDDFKLYDTEISVITYDSSGYGEEESEIINIHELAHKCKEWARSKNYMVTIFTHLDAVSVSLSVDGTQLYCSPSMSVMSEPESIFKACQWILDNDK